MSRPQWRTRRELEVLIHRQAAAAEGSDHQKFLKAIATTVRLNNARSGKAAGDPYHMGPSVNGIVITCNSRTQLGWIDQLCDRLGINMILPYLRPGERELILRPSSWSVDA